MEQLGSILKEIKQQSHSYAQVTISGDLFSRLLTATNEMRQEFLHLQQDYHSQRVKLHNLEALQRDWDEKSDLAETQMANWANQLSHSMNLVKSQILREQEIAAMWIGHVQREKDKNRFLESNMKIRNEEYSNLKVDFATLSEALRKAKGENEILQSAYVKAQKNESIAFQKKSEAEKELKQQLKLRDQLVTEHQKRQAEWAAAMQEVQAELKELRSEQMEKNSDSNKLQSRLRETQDEFAKQTKELKEAQAKIEKDAKLIKAISGLFIKGFAGRATDFEPIKVALEIPDLPKTKTPFLESVTEYPKMQKENSNLKSKCDQLLKQLEEVKQQSTAGVASKEKPSSKNTKAQQIEEENPRVSTERGSRGSRDAKSSKSLSPSTRPAVKMDEERAAEPPKPPTNKRGGRQPAKPAISEPDSPPSAKQNKGVSLSPEPDDKPDTPKKPKKGKNTKKAAAKSKKGAGTSKASAANNSDAAGDEDQREFEWDGDLADPQKVQKRSRSAEGMREKESHDTGVHSNHAAAAGGPTAAIHSPNKDNRYGSDFKRLVCKHPNVPDPHCEICRITLHSGPSFGTLSGLVKGSKKR